MPENRRETGAQNHIPGSEATRFKPGQSGNPGGRPKTAALSQACREVLAQPVKDDPEGRTYAEAIAEMLAAMALKGDIRAAQELADRAEGKSRQALDMSIKPHLSPMSDTERAEALAIIAKMGGE